MAQVRQDRALIALRLIAEPKPLLEIHKGFACHLSLFFVPTVSHTAFSVYHIFLICASYQARQTRVSAMTITSERGVMCSVHF